MTAVLIGGAFGAGPAIGLGSATVSLNTSPPDDALA